MNQKTEKRLWALANDLRHQLGPGEFVEILSQLSVMAALSRRDEELEGLISGADQSEKPLIASLLETGLASLGRQEASNPHELIDITSSGWSSLPAAWIQEALKVLVTSTQDPEQAARWLLRRARDRFRGTVSVPEEIPRLIAELYPEADSVYLPFDESALSVFEISNTDQTVTLRPRTEGAYRLLRRALFIANRDVTLQKLDPYSTSNVPEAFLTVVFPPFGEKLEPMRLMELPEFFQGASRLSSEELAVAGIGAAIQGVKADAGKHLLVLVPSGMLFRGGLSRMVREWLVEQLDLVSVVELPPRVLSNTSIGSALLWIMPVGGKLLDTVRLVSGESDEFLDEYQSGRFRLSRWRELARAVLSPPSEDHEAVVDIDKAELRENDYVLNPGRYQTQALDRLIHDARAVNLGSLCEIIRPVPVKDSDAESTKVYYEVLISNFERDGTIRRGSKERFLDAATESKVRRQKLKPGDILIGVKGTIGKAGIVTEATSDNLLAGQTTVILRLQDTDRVADPIYLLRYLSQPAVAEFLESMAGGSAIRFVRAKDLEALPVPIRSIEEQAKVCEIHHRIVSTIAESRRLAEEARIISESAFNTISKES